MIEEVQMLEMKNDISYNFFLYQKRKELDLNRVQFSKKLNIGYFRYLLIENGYIKPSKKDVAKISEFFNLDFNYYLDDSRGYPTEIPEKPKNKLISFFFWLIGTKAIRMTLIIISALFFTGFLTGFVGNNYVSENYRTFYEPTVLRVRDEIKDNGKLNFSLTGEIAYPQISKKTQDLVNNTEHLVQITSSAFEEKMTLRFLEFYWSDDYSFAYEVTAVDELGNYSLTIQLTNHITETSYFDVIDFKDGVFTFNLGIMTEEEKGYITNLLSGKDITANFEELINEELQIETDIYVDIFKAIKDGNAKKEAYSITFGMIHIFSLFGLALAVFGAAFAFIYGTKKGEAQIFRHGDELLFDEKKKDIPIKKDIKFVPFLPETIIEIIGIIFVFIGSARVILYGSLVIEYSSSILDMANRDLVTIQMMGMFLLYFIDFDLFMDDKRVLRNVAMYPIFFLVLYYAEAAILSSISTSGTIVATFLDYFLIPNPFGSVGCYFAIMAFLFFTPKYIKSKRGLIIYRSMSILPVIYLSVSFMIFYGDTFFGMDVSNYWFRYFFNCERLPYTILAVSYLFGLYFLRLFFKWKYGEEAATRYINGNRFIFLKNILISLVVIIVWAIDFAFANNATLNKMGIGINSGLIIFVPILLFYHPHKGPRNLVVDYSTMILYSISLGYAYVIAAFLVLLGIIVAL